VNKNVNDFQRNNQLPQENVNVLFKLVEKGMLGGKS
jgi:hypothetical protein